MRVYSIFDRKMREYGTLVVSNNDETVKRALLESMGANVSTLSKYPSDFDLMYLGMFNPETGLLAGSMSPRLVENVADIVKGGPDGARALSVVGDSDSGVGEVAS